MKRMDIRWNKLLSVLLAVCMIISMLPASALPVRADDEESVGDNWDGNVEVTMDLDEIEGDVTATDAELNIPEGKTLRVFGTVYVSGTLTVTGSGTLEVFGADGERGDDAEYETGTVTESEPTGETDEGTGEPIYEEVEHEVTTLIKSATDGGDIAVHLYL